jgi:hypothetical protein
MDSPPDPTTRMAAALRDLCERPGSLTTHADVALDDLTFAGRQSFPKRSFHLAQPLAHGRPRAVSGTAAWRAVALAAVAGKGHTAQRTLAGFPPVIDTVGAGGRAVFLLGHPLEGRATDSAVARQAPPGDLVHVLGRLRALPAEVLASTRLAAEGVLVTTKPIPRPLEGGTADRARHQYPTAVSLRVALAHPLAVRRVLQQLELARLGFAEGRVRPGAAAQALGRLRHVALPNGAVVGIC